MKRNKIAPIALSCLLIPAFAASPILTSCSEPKFREYHLLSINDIHGAIAGYGEDVVKVSSSNPGCLRLAREINKITKKYPGSVFVSAGDENSGDAWSVCSNGKTTYPVLSAMGVRYAAVGNHAFEWGLDDMASGRYDKLGRTDKTEGNYFVASNILSTNLYQNKDWCIDENNEQFLEDFALWQNQRVSWADPYKILHFGKGTVCLIGLTTANTLIDGNKKVTNQLSFIDYNASIHYTKYLAKQELGAAKYRQIDSFILLTHIDSDYKDKVLSGEAIKLATEVDTDIDAILSAHSHKTGCGKIWNNKLDKPILIGQAGTAGQSFLDTKLVFNPSSPVGKKLKSISMEVKKPEIPKTKDEAVAEWNSLLNTEDADLQPVVKEYLKQKEVVGKLVSEKIAEVTLDPTKTGETQPPKEGEQGYHGYYNSSIHSGKQIGHSYTNPDAILDHFGGWMQRATMIGFAIQYWDQVKSREIDMPSVCFSTQDSSPAEISQTDITLKDTFEMQPHDNTVHLGYLTLMQLANIFNYSLAGEPNDKGQGFNYEKRNQYVPDLTYFVPVDRSDRAHPIVVTKDAVRVAYPLKDDAKKPLIDSAYTCGMLMWYGVRPKLVEITDAERELEFKNPETGETRKVFDPTAKYRVATELRPVMVEGEEKFIYLPVMKIYDGSKLNFGDIDNPDATSSWHDEIWWYEHEHPSKSSGEEVKLIPLLINSFSYGGGNEQTKMFKQYCQYCFLNYGYQFYGMDTSENVRDLVTTFCRYSTPSTEEWTEFIIPTNIKWQVIEGLKEIELLPK